MMEDLNRKIAEKIMGFHLSPNKTYWMNKNGNPVWYSGYNNILGNIWEKLWNPLNDLNQCFEVVRKLCERGFDFSVDSFGGEKDGDDWYAVFMSIKDPANPEWFTAHSKTLQEAILKAALAVVEG